MSIFDNKTMRISIHKNDDLISLLKKYTEIDIFQDSLYVDFSSCWSLRGNFVAVIYGIIEQAKNIGLSCYVTPPTNDKFIAVLCKNNFLPGVLPDSYQMLDDENDTVIPLASVVIGDEQKYTSCIENLRLKGLRNVSEALYQKIVKQVAEMLNNSFRHSDSDGKLHYAGQFFPKQQKLYFTILDFGVGIKSNVNKYLNEKCSGADAIKWALQYQNSTMGEGGLGLTLLKELILKTNGELEIVSSDGYYKIVNGEEVYSNLDFIFHGTAINIVFNTTDAIFMKLKGE